MDAKHNCLLPRCKSVEQHLKNSWQQVEERGLQQLVAQHSEPSWNLDATSGLDGVVVSICDLVEYQHWNATSNGNDPDKDDHSQGHLPVACWVGSQWKDYDYEPLTWKIIFRICLIVSLVAIKSRNQGHII